MELIDKSAIVAEIEKLKGKISDSSSYCNGWQHALRMLELSLDTLEVKEVGLPNFEQEVKEFCYRFDDRKESWYNMTPHDKNIMVSPTWSNFAMQLAKHFFELGMQVSNKEQKGE